jgi:ABC-type Fe3+/spermidine/putrescine transport system ATPase subunit
MSIRVDELTKRFGAQRVLDRVSLEVAPGELFVLLGASGSGKSTMLRVVAGLTPPDRGRVWLAGRDVTGVRAQDRGTGFVFQNYSVFRHMTVARNIEFGLKLRGWDGAERARRRDELLELVGLPGFASREAIQLSGGQQQRVAIARALAYEPKVLLLDEPFGALDVKIRKQLRRSLRAIHDRLKITTLLVTHDQEEAFELADRVGIMDRGRLIEIGSAEALYARPRTLFAATFVGSGTVLVGRVEHGEARFPGLEFRVPTEPREEGAHVHLLVRPEDVAVSATRPASTGTLLGAGKIIDRSFAGASSRVRIRVPTRTDVHQASSPPPDPDALIVDALVPSVDPLPERDVWVSLRRWHVLEPPEPSLLVAEDGRGSTGTLEFARELAKALHARITILGVAADARESDRLGGRIESRQRRVGLADCDLRVRYGSPVTQILNEQSELLSQLIVLAPRPSPFAWLDRGAGARSRVRLGKTILALLESTRVPVLIAIAPNTQVKRMSVIQIASKGARDLARASAALGRPLGVGVTWLDASQPTARANPGHEGGANDPALASLASLRPAWQTISGQSLEGTVTEALAVPSELLVLPVERRGVHSVNAIPPLVIELLARADRPVMVVPTLARDGEGDGRATEA